MIKVPYERIIKIIEENSDLTQEQIEKRIRSKLDQLSGLISKEGASHILANELGININEKSKEQIDLSKLIPGMRDIGVAGKITAIYEVREFTRNERTGKVGSFMIADEAGRSRVVCWGSQADQIKDLEIGDVIKINNAYAKKNSSNNFIELHLNDQATLEVNPPGLDIQVAQDAAGPSQEYVRKTISTITGNDQNIELLGYIVQLYPPNFYEICPTCGKRARQQGQGNICPVHDVVEPSYGYVINFALDDGTENPEDVRFVCFRQQVEELLEKTSDEISELRLDPDSFEAIKQQVLGKQVLIRGRASINENFNRIEVVAQHVDNDPDPQAELERLQECS